MAIVVPSYRTITGERTATNTSQDSALVYYVIGTTDRVAIPNEYVDDDCVEKGSDRHHGDRTTVSSVDGEPATVQRRSG